MTRPICAANIALLIELHLLSRARGADVEDRVAVGAEQWRRASDRVIASADEQRDVPGRNVMWPAADRCVDNVDVRARCGDRLSSQWAARGVQDQRRTGFHRIEQPALEACLIHLLVGEHADDDGVGPFRRLDDLADGVGIQFFYRPALLVSTGEDVYVVAGLGETATMGAPIRPAPMNPTRISAGGPLRPARCRPR